MRRIRCTLTCLLFVLCAMTPAGCWEAVDRDEHPAISWGGGLMLFERDPHLGSRLMLYMGKSDKLVTILPSIESGTGKIDLLSQRCEDILHQRLLPSIAPDSRMIAWTEREEGPDTDFGRLAGYEEFQNIFVADLDTAEAFRLTSKGGTLPVWSPDSNWLAYLTPQGQIKARNIHTKETKLLAEKPTTAEKLTWLHSGPAVSVVRDNAAAWYAIQPSGELKRITEPIPVPERQGTLNPYGNTGAPWDWALSRDGRTLIYVEDSRISADSASRCLVMASDRNGIRKLAEMDAETYKYYYAGGPAEPYVAVSGSGEKFVISVAGGIWKGDVKTGHLIRITGPSH